MTSIFEEFDPLFDDDEGLVDSSSSGTTSVLAPKPAFTLSLPTFEEPTPVSEPASFGFSARNKHISASAAFDDFFDQNVGTIALSGSHSRSEHPSLPIASMSSRTGVIDGDPIAESQLTKATSTPPSRRSKSKATGLKKGGANPPALKRDKARGRQPASTCDAVLQRLAQDPNVMPLLQAIVEYVYRAKLIPVLPQPVSTSSRPSTGASSPVSPPSHQSPIPGKPNPSQPPPFKRRKLNRVPAGAEDWAIPFPDHQGSDPKSYFERWDSRQVMALLQSLLRNLRNWKSQHGVVRIRPQPSARNLKFEKESRPARHPHLPVQTQDVDGPKEDSGNGVGSDMFDFEFLAQMEQFDLGAIDSLLMSMSSDGALGLSFGGPEVTSDGLSQSEFSSYTNPVGTDPSWSSMMGTQPLIEASPSQALASSSHFAGVGVGAGVIDDASLASIFNDGTEYGAGDGTMVGPPFSFDFNVSDLDLQQSQLGLDFLGTLMQPKQPFEWQMDVEMDQTLAEMDFSVSAATTSVPSMTASPMTSAITDVATPQTTVASQPSEAPPPLKNVPQPFEIHSFSLPVEIIGHHPVAAVSKRGRGRSTVALRRDIQKRPQETGKEKSPGSTVSGQPITTQGPTSKEKRKIRASEATVKRREETLEKASEWRGMLEKQLQAARKLRWEIMMEGLVLREAAEFVRNGTDENSVMSEG